MAEPKEGFNSGIDRNISGTIDSDGDFIAGTTTSVGIGVTGSTYSADKATSTSAANEAIPTGAVSLWVCNESITSTEIVRFEFNVTGTSTALATRGFKVSPGITTAVGDNGPTSLAIPVPSEATHWSWISQAGTPTINVVWGG